MVLAWVSLDLSSCAPLRHVQFKIQYVSNSMGCDASTKWKERWVVAVSSYQNKRHIHSMVHSMVHRKHPRQQHAYCRYCLTGAAASHDYGSRIVMPTAFVVQDQSRLRFWGLVITLVYNIEGCTLLTGIVNTWQPGVDSSHFIILLQYCYNIATILVAFALDIPPILSWILNATVFRSIYLTIIL
jgi:hypothetical protein